MNWLTRLKNTECPDTHPTKPTKPSSGDVLGGFVGFVGTPQAHIENSLSVSEAANDPESIPDIKAYIAQFNRRGLPDTQADTLTDVLVIRDREQDERRTCLECSHCSGSTPLAWRCGNHRAAGVGRELGCDIAVMLQRCPGFKSTRQCHG